MLIQPKYVKVSVKKDPMVTIVRDVFDHEVPLLKEIHGEGAVEIVDHVVPPVILEPIDAAEEYGRLAGKYGMHETQPKLVVEVVYGIYSTGTFLDHCHPLEERKSPRRGRPPLEAAAA